MTGPTRAERGKAAEDAVAVWLVARGHEVLGANVRVGRLEIDLVWRDGPVVAVVEVRTRGPGAWLGPFASIDARKRERVRRAGSELWRVRYSREPWAERMRFDVAAVRPGPDGAEVEYVKAAF